MMMMMRFGTTTTTTTGRSTTSSTLLLLFFFFCHATVAQVPVVDAFVVPTTTRTTTRARTTSSSSSYASSKTTTALFVGGPRTLYDKIWDDHVVDDDGMSTLLYVDRHLVHEVTSPQAFEGLRLASRGVRRPDCTLVTVDHNVPTEDRSQLIDVQTFIAETASRTQVMQLDQNVKDFDLRYFGMADERQGIVHIIGPEQGFTLPGCVTVCGDSHTATHGAFGALAFGIGTSEVEHVLATQVRFIFMFYVMIWSFFLFLVWMWNNNILHPFHFPLSYFFLRSCCFFFLFSCSRSSIFIYIHIL